MAARYDKAVFLEKPIATTVADAATVCDIALAHRAPVRVGLQYRYKAIYAEAIAEILDRGCVGTVHSVAMLEHRFPFLDKVGQWNKFDEYTGGALVEKCCHYFDLINMMARSQPEQVFALGNQAVNFLEFSRENKPANGIDQAQVSIRYAGGVIGAFSLCMFAPGSREELIVCGDAGRLQATETSALGEANQNRLEIWAGENGASRVIAPEYPSYIRRAGHHGSTFFEHLAFADDIKAGRNTGPRPSEAFWSVVVGAAAQASIAQGCAVDVIDVIPKTLDVASLGAMEWGTN